MWGGKSLRVSIGAVVLALALSSCTKGGGESSASDSNSCSFLGKISNGDKCSVERTAVVPILFVAGGNLGSCTGTLISLTSVLTAAHCIPANTSEFSIITNDGVFDLQNEGIAGVAVHPEYSTNPNGSTNFDVAIIRLSRPVSNAPMAIYTSRPVSVGDRITVAGYGMDEKGESLFDRLKKEDRYELLKAGEMEVTYSDNRLIGAEFDKTGQSVCPGDSGGPAFQERNGITGIVGITSFGSIASCTEQSFAAFTGLGHPQVRDFILQFVPDASVL